MNIKNDWEDGCICLKRILFYILNYTMVEHQPEPEMRPTKSIYNDELHWVSRFLRKFRFMI